MSTIQRSRKIPRIPMINIVEKSPVKMKGLTIRTRTTTKILEIEKVAQKGALRKKIRKENLKVTSSQRKNSCFQADLQLTMSM